MNSECGEENVRDDDDDDDDGGEEKEDKGRE
jgi:hypothetical protein